MFAKIFGSLGLVGTPSDMCEAESLTKAEDVRANNYKSVVRYLTLDTSVESWSPVYSQSTEKEAWIMFYLQ